MLLVLFLIPFGAAIISMLAGRRSVSFLLSLLPLALLIYGVDSTIDYAWFPALGIRFRLSVDALSLIFIYLTAIIVPIALLVAPLSGLMDGLILVLQGLLIGFFASRDLVFFTLFWEAILLPLYFIITMQGGSHRYAAALKFIVYMVAGSALLVAAVLALYFTANSFDMDVIGTGAPLWVALVFLLAFAVKTPLFPFHAWLPDTYTEAPTAGTILLSALLSKAGVYGFLRVGMEFFPQVLQSPLLLGLAIVGVFYGGLAAWRQNNYKRMLAYSSFSHVNFILAGIFAWNAAAETGAIVQAFNHAVTITGLFLVAYWLEQRIGTTEMNLCSGLAAFFPQLCWLTLVFVLSSVALPGTNNFVGELLILFGMFQENPILAAVLSLTVILSAIYMLRWMQTMYFREPYTHTLTASDIHWKEWLIALPLIALIFWMGLYPAPLLNIIQNKVTP